MIIKVANVSKKIKNNIILDNVNLELRDGTIYGFVGRNGCGKSMLFKTICGFISPDSGTILQDNRDIYLENSFPSDTRALIEKPEYVGNLDAVENLDILAKIQNKITKEDIIETLVSVNLDKEMHKKFREFSLGMKQKLGIAQVLMENPKVMILDEPFNGVDNESVLMIKKILLKKKEEGHIILLATHIPDDIKDLCDKVYMMDNGKIVN